MSFIRKTSPNTRMEKMVHSSRSSESSVSITIDSGTPIGLLLVLTYPQTTIVQSKKAVAPVSRMRK